MSRVRVYCSANLEQKIEGIGAFVLENVETGNP